MKFFQKISATAFLAVLLFALSGKTIHVLSEDGHEHDFICSETSTHFHEQEHACFICDFELVVSDHGIPDGIQISYCCPIKEEVSNAIFFVFSETHFEFTSRGPPAA